MSSDAQYILPFLRLMKLQLTCVHYYIYVTSQFATTKLSPGSSRNPLPNILYFMERQHRKKCNIMLDSDCVPC